MNNNQHQNTKTTTATVGGTSIKITSKKQEVKCCTTVEAEVTVSATPIEGVEKREITTVDLPDAFLNFAWV